VAQSTDALDLKSTSPAMGFRCDTGQSDQFAQPHRARRAERFSSPLPWGFESSRWVQFRPAHTDPFQSSIGSRRPPC